MDNGLLENVFALMDFKIDVDVEKHNESIQNKQYANAALLLWSFLVRTDFSESFPIKHTLRSRLMNSYFYASLTEHSTMN